MKALALAAILAAPSVQAATPTIESLRQAGAALQRRIQGPTLPSPTDPAEREKNLRIARRAGERAYRVWADMKMLERTVAEARAELAQLKIDPKDQARQDRVQGLLKFVIDALPRENDLVYQVFDATLYLQYSLPKPVDAEFAAAVKALDDRTIEADDAGKDLNAAIVALALETQGGPGLSERIPWLAGRLAEDEAKLVDFSDAVRAETARLRKKLPPGV